MAAGNFKKSRQLTKSKAPKKRGKYYYVKWLILIFLAIMFALNMGMKNNKADQREQILAGRMLGFMSGNSFDLDGDGLEELIVLEESKDSYGMEATLYVAGGDGSGMKEAGMEGKGLGEKIYLHSTDGVNIQIKIPKNSKDESEGYHIFSYKDGELVVG